MDRLSNYTLNEVEDKVDKLMDKINEILEYINIDKEEKIKKLTEKKRCEKCLLVQ